MTSIGTSLKELHHSLLRNFSCHYLQDNSDTVDATHFQKRCLEVLNKLLPLEEFPNSLGASSHVAEHAAACDLYQTAFNDFLHKDNLPECERTLRDLATFQYTNNQKCNERYQRCLQLIDALVNAYLYKQNRVAAASVLNVYIDTGFKNDITGLVREVAERCLISNELKVVHQLLRKYEAHDLVETREELGTQYLGQGKLVEATSILNQLPQDKGFDLRKSIAQTHVTQGNISFAEDLVRTSMTEQHLHANTADCPILAMVIKAHLERNHLDEAKRLGTLLHQTDKTALKKYNLDHILA